tara:strand:+ start:359 stop:712 length:354 start_codon:yes stop_codon:yes gene_type:complete
MDWGIATMKNVEFENPSPRFFSGTSLIIAVEEIANQEYGQRLQVVLGKEEYAKDRNDGFFTRIRRPSDDNFRGPPYPEWAGHYNMTLIQAAVDFETRIRGTGNALKMLHYQVQEVKR